MYDPESHGTRCDLCPLRSVRLGKPVPPEWPARPLALLVGANPGPEEVKRGQPFIGPAGLELMRALGSVGIRRSQVAITNAILCAPPGPPRGALERFLHTLQKENKLRAEEGAEPIPTPTECCRGRLFHEIADLPNVVALGNTAMHAITGRPCKILEARGGPRQLERVEGEGTEGDSLQIPRPARPAMRLLPTLHPSFILSSRRWAGPFRADLGRAFRWFTSGLAWKDPRVLLRPSPSQLDAFLTSIQGSPFSVFDVETFPGFRSEDHYDPLFDRLKCIGIGTGDGRACVVPFRSIESGGASFYTEVEKPQIVKILKNYLTSNKWKKAGWNSRYYDRMVLEARLGVIPTPHLDGIGLSKLAEPEMPHSLGFAGSIYTDVDNWKAGHVATDAASDRQLWDYNAKDCAVTAMAIPRLAEVAKERRQLHLLPFFARLQDVCAELHRNGMFVNQEKRREWDRRLLKQAQEKRKLIQEMAGRPELNPASYPQIGDLFFNHLGIAPHHYSEKTGEPSTDDDSLRAFLSETWGLDPKRRALVSALRDFRRVTKRRGVVVRLRPITESEYQEPQLIDLDESPEEREERVRRALRGKSARAPGLCLPDGRVHADWNAHGTVGWRFSSSNPNLQNLEDKLRDCFEAAPGYVLVACDEAQLELRMVAGLSNCRYYLDAFRSGGDPHKQLCIDTFSDRFLSADPPQQKKLRRSVKELTYSGLYGAGDETKLEVVTSAEEEDEAGESHLIFPDFTLREVAAFTANWHRRNPEIEVWWESIVEEWKKQGFLLDPILGLRCDFLDGEDRSKLLNYKPQAGGAALAHKALFKAKDSGELERLRARLVQQGHDSIVFEVPMGHERWIGTKETPAEFGYCPPGCLCLANRTARLLEESMKEDGRQWGLDVDFIGEAKIGRSWKSV